MCSEIRAAALLILAIALIFASGCLVQQQAPAQQPEIPGATSGEGNATPQPLADANAIQQPETQPAIPLSPAQLVELCQREATDLLKDLCIIDKGKTYNNAEVCTYLNVQMRDTCYYDIAVQNKNGSLCGRILVTSKRNGCYAAVALAEKDSGWCGSIALVDSNSYEKDTCIKKVAVAVPSIAPCKEITDLAVRDLCYQEIAVKNNDYTICANVSTRFVKGTYVRNTCYLSFAKTKVICSKLIGGFDAYRCYDDVGRSELDYTACMQIDDNQNKANCLDYVARNSSDVSICDLITDINSVQANACISYVAVQSPSATVCPKLTDYAKRNNCYYRLALNTKDSTACAQIIGDRKLKDFCLLRVAVLSYDSSICSGISADDFNYLDNCRKPIAEHNYDLNLCEMMYNTSNYINCFVNIALSLGKPEVCVQMQNDRFVGFLYDNVSLCYRDFAVSLGDSTYCSLIDNNALYSECVNEI